jgi:DsbC/DsbD-like thiol-disulfide interchange protein
MMRQTTLVSVYCLLLLALCACGKAEKKDAPTASSAPSQATTSEIVSSASVVRVNVAGVEAAAGGAAQASVNLTITSGYHVNANPPSASYLIPTELSVETGEGIAADKPVYPPSITKKFAFDPKPLAVYEGEASIKLPLKVASTASKGEHTLKAKVRVQACDDKACYRPSTIETSIPVTVK